MEEKGKSLRQREVNGAGIPGPNRGGEPFDMESEGFEHQAQFR